VQHGLVLARHRPQFEFGRVTGDCRDVDAETRGLQVVQWGQHLDRVVSGGEHGVVLHEHVALFGGDHQDVFGRIRDGSSAQFVG